MVYLKDGKSLEKLRPKFYKECWYSSETEMCNKQENCLEPTLIDKAEMQK
jgi:hypothetical protein